MTAEKETIAIEETLGRLADRIYKEIIEQIVIGNFCIGDRPPSERQPGAE